MPRLVGFAGADVEREVVGTSGQQADARWLHTRERAVAGLVTVVLLAGIFAALAPATAGEDRIKRANAGAVNEFVIQDIPNDDDLDTTQTSAVRIGTLDIASHAPSGAVLTLPPLAPVDFGDGVMASAPVTGGFTDLISSYFGPVTMEALIIVQCESQFVPWAVGTNTNGTQDHGLFQINDVHRGSFEAVTGQPWESGRYDPVSNTAFARWLYDQSGWRPWTCRSRLDAPA